MVDKETAPIIRRIFQGKVDGMSDGAIAKELNEDGILSPFAYRYAKGLVRAEKYREMP
ncbi:MAG: recombinase family protein [Lachnotalea sp.]